MNQKLYLSLIGLLRHFSDYISDSQSYVHTPNNISHPDMNSNNLTRA